MSEGPAKLIRTAIEGWNRRGIEGVIEFARPDTEIYAFPEWPDERRFVGKDGWRALMSVWMESFDDIQWDIERIEEVGDRVVALVHNRSRIKVAGVPISQRIGAVFGGFRGDGKVGEGHFFLTWEEALEAAGLSE